jgi:radical SAM superfamily enzyme YgiQ (UPF0313 family)
LIIRWRRCSKENLERTLRYIKDNYFSFILFNDEILTVNKRFLAELCDITKKYDIYWSSQARADHITPEIAQMLRDGNCVHLSIGVESFDQHTLNEMRKKTTVEQNINAINLCYQYGIYHSLSYVLGMPGEDRKVIFNNRKGIWKSYFASDIINCAFLNPYPGTSAYYYGLNKGYISDKKYVHEKLVNKEGLFTNFTELSMIELEIWKHWVIVEAAISYRIKHSVFNITLPFLEKIKSFLKSYLTFFYEEPINFLVFNIYLLKGFVYWLKPVQKMKYGESAKTLISPEKYYLRKQVIKRIRHLLAKPG